MEYLSKKTKENIIEKPKIKEGVDFVFEQNSKLSQIGNKEQYSEYLDTIFPESKVKGFVYHQTAHDFNEFDFSKGKTPGVYFSPFNKSTPKLVNLLFTGKYQNNTKVAVINITNPFFAKESKYERGVTNINILRKKVDLSKYDGVVGYVNCFYYKNEFEKGYLDTEKDKSKAEIIVFNDDQIHILGSRQDLENFKKFVDPIKN